MTAEGAIFFIIILCLVLPLAGLIAELLICRVRNEKLKAVLPVGGFLLYVVCGLIELDFYTGSAAFFGAVTIGAFVGWIINYIAKNRSQR